MANQISIARWVLNNKAVLKPSFVSYDWPERYFTGLADFSATLTIDGIETTGRGIDFDENVALEKACAEAVERGICRHLKIDSIGVAVSGESGAEIHAKNEALERYFFNQHRRARLPFLPLPNASSEFERFREIRSKFDSKNGSVGKLSIYKMAVPDFYSAFVAVISQDNTPSFLGLSLNSRPDKAIPRAFFEAMSNFARFRDNPAAFETERRQPDLWNCDPAYISEMSDLFHTEEFDGSTFNEPNLLPIFLDISKLSQLEGCPIHPIKFVVAGA